MFFILILDWRKTDQDRAKKNRVVKLIAAIHQQSPRVKNGKKQ